MRQLPSEALQPHAVGLAEALDKGRFAGEPGIVDHRIAQQQLVVTLVVEQQQVFIVNRGSRRAAAARARVPSKPGAAGRADSAAPGWRYRACRWRELRPGGLNLTRSPPARPGPPPQQIIHQQRAAKKAAVGIPRIAGQRIPGEQPQRQVELTLAQGAVDLPQLVQRIMFAGGRAAAVCLGQIQLFVGICTGRRENPPLPAAASGTADRSRDRWEQSGARSPAAAAAAGDEGPALLPPGGLARSFAGLRRPVPDKAPAIERGWRKMVGGELQEALQQVAAGGDAGVQDHLPAHRRQPAKNLLQVVPAGVAGHLRIVPAGAEQPTAEKGIVDIDGIHR